MRRGPYYPLLSTAALTTQWRCCWGTSLLSQTAGDGAGFRSLSSQALGTFPRQHLPLFSRRLISPGEFLPLEKEQRGALSNPVPPTYQQSATERGTPSSTEHEEGPGAPVLPLENGRVLQLTLLLSKLRQLLPVPR